MDHLQLAGTVDDRPIGARHNAAAAVVSASSHALFVVFALMLVHASTTGGDPGAALHNSSAKILFFEDPRDGRGGGGSGNQHAQPSRAAEMPGRDRSWRPDRHYRHDRRQGKSTCCTDGYGHADGVHG